MAFRFHKMMRLLPGLRPSLGRGGAGLTNSAAARPRHRAARRARRRGAGNAGFTTLWIVIAVGIVALIVFL